MAETFAELYAPLLKDVFTRHAQEKLNAGADGITCAIEYAQQGKPEFTLAFLLLINLSEEEKRELLAYSYEQRAKLSEEKAEALNAQFQRPFPLIKLEAQNDRKIAHQIRRGLAVPNNSTKIPPVS